MSLALNLGCGKDILEGWENIDLYPSDPRVIAADVCNLRERYAGQEITAIRAIDVLEHLGHRVAEAAFLDWCAMLAPGGLLTVRVPDARYQASLLISGAWSIRVWSHMVFGGQDAAGNYHASGFDEAYLRDLAGRGGIRVVSVTYERYNISNDLNSANVNIELTGVKTCSESVVAVTP